VVSRRVLGSVIVALVLSAVVSGLAFAVVLAPGDPAPQIIARDLGGEYRKTVWGDHELTLVNFWATWCEPCRVEMPALQKTLDRLGDRGLHVVGVLALDAADNFTAQRFLESMGVSYPTVRADRKFLGQWGGVGSLPTSYLVNKNGRVARRYVGASDEQIEALIYDIEALLDGRPMGPMVMPEVPAAQTPPVE
jgi:thiol-disulfide isomerase/thioredoxin